MVNVVFVAPFLMRATTQFLEGVMRLDGINLILITQRDSAEVQHYKEHGLHVHLCDDCLDVDLLIQELQTVQEEDGPIHRLLGILEELQEPLAKAREALGIKGMNAQTALHFREKSVMKDVMRAAGLPCAAHCLAGSVREAVGFARRTGFPLVAKPPAGAGTRDTWLIEDEEQLQEYLETHSLCKSAPSLFEEYVSGDEYTFESAMIDGELVWHGIARYEPSPLRVLLDPKLKWRITIPREVDHPFFDQIRQLGRRALRALGMRTGFSHMEWFHRQGGSILISEVAARPPGGQLTSLHAYAHDFDIYREWAALMIFDRFNPPPRAFAAGAAFLRGMGSGTVREVYGSRRVAADLNGLIVESDIPEMGQPRSSSYKGEGYFMVRHPVTSVVERALDHIDNTVHVQMG